MRRHSRRGRPRGLRKPKKEATAASARRRGIGTGILNALYVARLRVITFSRPGMFAT